MHITFHSSFISNYIIEIKALYKLIQERCSHRTRPSKRSLETKQTCTTRYILDFEPNRSRIFVHCRVSVRMHAKKATIWSRACQRWRNKTNKSIYSWKWSLATLLYPSCQPTIWFAKVIAETAIRLPWCTLETIQNEALLSHLLSQQKPTQTS